MLLIIIHSMNYKILMLKIAFILFLGTWFVVAVGRTIYNLYTLPSDMSDTSVLDRQNAYLQNEAFVHMKMLPDKEIVIDTQDAAFYFFSRNHLYPKRLYRLEENRHKTNLLIITH